MSFLKELITLKALVVTGAVGFGLIALKRYANGPMSQYNSQTTNDLKGKTVIITGGNAGLGVGTALEIAKCGAHVVLACRDAKKGEAAAADIAKTSGNPSVEAMTVDVSSFDSIKAFVAAFKAKHKHLHVLINNAGMPDTKQRELTKDGIETVFATNHLGPQYLTNSLLDVLKASAPSRIVNVSSGLEAMADLDLNDLQYAKRTYGGVYEQSKLCNILFTSELGRRLEGSGVITVSLRPGFVPTTDMTAKISGSWFYRGIGKPLLWPISKDLVHGVQTSIFCAAAPAKELVNGAYYGDCAIQKPRHKLAQSEATAKQLWDISEKLIADATKKAN